MRHIGTIGASLNGMHTAVCIVESNPVATLLAYDIASVKKVCLFTLCEWPGGSC